MATYTLDEVVDGVKTTLSEADSLVRKQTYDELTEDIPEYPLLQVYPEENTGTDWTGETDRITLSGKHSVKEYIIHADLYAKRRGPDIGEEMGQLVTSINELENILDNISCPPFGVDAIMSFRWHWSRVVFSYGGTDYVGARFVITLRVG